MNREKSKLIISIFVLFVFSIGIGYAYLTSNLSITGSTKVNANTWDIHFNNVQVSNGSVSLVTGDQAATIDPTDTTKITYAIGLNQPGDYYEFNVDIVNAGTINGMIGSVESKVNNQDISNLPSYINYSVKFLDGDILEPNFLLEAGNTETIKVRIEFKEDISEDDLLDIAATLNFSLQVNYTQARSNAVDRLASYYLFTNNGAYVGTDVSELGSVFNTYQEAFNGIAFPFLLRHSIKQHSNKVYKTSVVFVVDDNDYYLIGGVDESSLSTRPVYEANKAVLLNLFESANCVEKDDDGIYMECSNSGLYSVVHSCGLVNLKFNINGCKVHDDGSSFCYGGSS